MTRAEWEGELADYGHLQQIAAQYEAKCAKVRTASGYAPAEARIKAALDALLALLAAIMAQQETTMAGVVVKAQALTAWGKLHCMDGVRLGALQWGPQLAGAIMRLSTANAAEG